METKMYNLRERRDGSVVFDTGGQLISFNGTPNERRASADNWPIVGQAPSLAAWQDNPPKWGTDFAATQVLARDGETFYYGGSWLWIRNWARDNGATITPNQVIFATRDKAAEVADSLNAEAS